MRNDIEFRFASENDSALILEFIRALAAYEKISDEVIATEVSLREWIFEKKKAEVIFALTDNKEIGFALFFNNFSTFLGKAGIYLEDLFVLPEYRGRGCGRLEWACLDWNKPSIDFYLSLAAKPMEQWTTYRLAGDSLTALADKA